MIFHSQNKWVHTQQYVFCLWSLGSSIHAGFRGQVGSSVLDHGIEELAALAELRSNEDAPGAKMINCEL